MKTQYLITIVIIAILIIAGFSYFKITGNTIINNNINIFQNNNGNTMESANPKVLLRTSEGDITIELDREKAPITVENFLSYVKSGSYDGTVFHRVIKDFMIQGGGFTPDGIEKPTNAPIKLESGNGLKNLEGTIAMARTSDPNSATNQFFINTKDNSFLDKGIRDDGYAVFGKVVSGMDVVKKIESPKTTVKNRMQDWPEKDVMIIEVKII